MRVPALNESSALRYFSFFYLYLMQGVPAGFALTAMANYLLGQHVSSSDVGTFVAIVGLPWTIQFVWGPLIDRFQYSIIGHRKHWVVLAQLVAVAASLSLLLVKDPVHQLTLLSAVFFVHSTFASIQDASVDAIAIEIVPASERGRVNAFMRGGFLMGVAAGAAGLSTLLHAYGFSSAAIAQSGTLFLLTVLTFFIKLDRADPLLPKWGRSAVPRASNAHNPTVSWLFREVYRGIFNSAGWRSFVIIAGIYLCSSIFIRSYSYYLIHDLQWPDRQVSLLQGSWGSAITLVAVLLGGVLSDRIGAKKLQTRVMIGIGVFVLIVSGVCLLSDNKIFLGGALITWNLADPLFSVAAFPVLMALCLPKVEGSQFTTYMALINLCDVTGSYLTGWLVQAVTPPLIEACCGVVIFALFALARYSNQRPLERLREQPS